MWIPVVESHRLRASALAAHYWGTPIVLFRTETGRIAALEDACGHRGVPLSKGRVTGECIRCPYHHFAFDARGACTSIPDVFAVGERERRDCRVRSFHVRERLGLIWVSIEPEASAPFPIADDVAPPPGTECSTGLFELSGDLRVWMEHYLDYGHAIFAHAGSLYGGGDASGYASTESIHFGIGPESRCPVRSAATIELRTPRTSPARAVIQSGGLLGYLKRAFTGAAGKPSFIRADAHLLTPLTQMVDLELASGYGTYKYMNLASLVPVSRERTLFIYSAFIRRGDGRSFGPLLRRFADAYLRHTIEVAHIKGEDEVLLAGTPYRDDFFATSWDAAVVGIRALTARYVREKGHLYPEGSLLHTVAPAEGPRPANARTRPRPTRSSPPPA